jgi:hypothetical protein
LIPSILVTWLIIGLTTIGCAILLFGYVVMPFSLKLALLLAFRSAPALMLSAGTALHAGFGLTATAKPSKATSNTTIRSPNC